MNAIKLAIRFHELYEKYAPEYGYDTKEESRTFDASSPCQTGWSRRRTGEPENDRTNLTAGEHAR